MVVVAIIGILMAAGILAFSNAQLNARDSKRMADLDGLAKLLEQYYTDNGQYPAVQVLSNNANWTGSFTTTLSQYQTGGLALPVDPKNVAPNYYTVRSADRVTMGDGTSKFCLATRPENLTKANCTAPPGGTYDCPFVTTGATHYCVENRQ